MSLAAQVYVQQNIEKGLGIYTSYPQKVYITHSKQWVQKSNNNATFQLILLNQVINNLYHQRIHQYISHKLRNEISKTRKFASNMLLLKS